MTMRSTQKKGPRTRAVKLMHAARPGSTTTRAKLALAAAQMLASQASAGLAAFTTTQVINAMWDNSQRREPPEPEPTTQIVPKPPLCPAGGAMRTTSVTVLPDGGTRIDVGDQLLRLNAKEADALSWCFSSSCGRRGRE